MPKGEILILWRDIDNQLMGWQVMAHNEDIVLKRVSTLIKRSKLKKLEQITGIKKNISSGIENGFLELEEEEYLDDDDE